MGELDEVMDIARGLRSGVVSGRSAAIVHGLPIVGRALPVEDPAWRYASTESKQLARQDCHALRVPSSR